MTKVKDMIKLPELKHVCGDFNGVSYREGYNKALEEIRNMDVPWQRLDEKELLEEIEDCIERWYYHSEFAEYMKIAIMQRFAMPAVKDEEICLNCGCKKYTHQKCTCGYPQSVPAVEIDVEEIIKVLDNFQSDELGTNSGTRKIAQAIADNLKRIVK